MYAYHYNCIVAGRTQNYEITRNVDKILSENLCDIKVSENRNSNCWLLNRYPQLLGISLRMLKVLLRWYNNADCVDCADFTWLIS